MPFDDLDLEALAEGITELSDTVTEVLPKVGEAITSTGAVILDTTLEIGSEILDGILTSGLSSSKNSKESEQDK